jgi:hypothetical protein
MTDEVKKSPVPTATVPVVVEGRPFVAKPEEAPETHPFKLKPGMRHTHNGVAVTPGDTVELTKVQAEAFADKFELVKADKPVAAPVSSPEVPARDPGTVKMPPQDLGAKTSVEKDVLLGAFAKPGDPTKPGPVGPIPGPPPATPSATIAHEGKSPTPSATPATTPSTLKVTDKT